MTLPFDPKILTDPEVMARQIRSLQMRIAEIEGQLGIHLGPDTGSAPGQNPHSSQFGTFALTTTPTKTIASGAIRIDDLLIAQGPIPRLIDIKVDTESAAASDDLDSVNFVSSALYGARAGQTVLLRPANTARVVTVKDGTGNLNLSSDFVMSQDTSTILLVNDGSNWLEVARGVGAVLRTSPIITPFSPESFGVYLSSVSAGGPGKTNSNWADIGTYYYPFVINDSFTIKRVFWSNGTVAGTPATLAFAVYNEDFSSRLVSVSATTQSGNDTLQITDITDYTLTAGKYWIGLGINRGTIGSTTDMYCLNMDLREARAIGVLGENNQQCPASPSPTAFSSGTPQIMLCGISSTDTF